ncbi:acyl-CoA desaturase [Legionella waltersii]|uniref:Fatty acid desaturase n=1 Tax=Legionella waltersii TaxID=66969 RepID=A0A0W1A5P7_9GAMM|nr:fatty acid desaturase [Legionella waltersii]KTD76601.1 fatty acid desaturase [Legionella waltersii]SNU94588.1 fatty acid desaturase [Legionella waltersii]
MKSTGNKQDASLNKLSSNQTTPGFLHFKYSLIIIGIIVLFWGTTLAFPTITHGLIGSNFFYCLLYLVLTLHITLVTISVYLHRSETHRAVTFHPAVRHFFRFWLWLFTGTNRGGWVAVHRLHHQNPDTEKDPHSPVVYGLKKIFTHGIELYSNAKTPEAIAKFGCVTDDDVLEKKLYAKLPVRGPLSLFLIQLVLLGIWAIPLWTIQMILQILMQASVINGLGHAIGYRNFNTQDNSHNLTRWGIIVGGEELHNNHHLNPASAKFSFRTDEYDIGWFYICVLRRLGLATIKLKPVASIDLKYTKGLFKDLKNRSSHVGQMLFLALFVCVVL